MCTTGPRSSTLAVLLLLGLPLWACHKSSPTEPRPPACTFSVSKTSLSFGAAGGSDSVNVATASNCAWSAASNTGWMTISGGASGTGNGVVQVAVTANSTESARTGTLTIAGVSVTVNEDGLAPPPCTYTVSPVALVFGSGGGSDSVTVTTATNCSWTAADDRDWFTVANGASGTGNGTVRIEVLPNPTDASRIGTLTVAGQGISVRQDALAPCSIDISPANASYSKDAATGSVAVTAPAHCEWSAASSASWVEITSGSQGTGNGIVTYLVAANGTALARSATMSIGNRTFTVSQGGDTGSCDTLFNRSM